MIDLILSIIEMWHKADAKIDKKDHKSTLRRQKLTKSADYSKKAGCAKFRDRYIFLHRHRILIIFAKTQDGAFFKNLFGLRKTGGIRYAATGLRF